MRLRMKSSPQARLLCFNIGQCKRHLSASSQEFINFYFVQHRNIYFMQDSRCDGYTTKPVDKRITNDNIETDRYSCIVVYVHQPSRRVRHSRSWRCPG